MRHIVEDPEDARDVAIEVAEAVKLVFVVV